MAASQIAELQPQSATHSVPHFNDSQTQDSSTLAPPSIQFDASSPQARSAAIDRVSLEQGPNPQSPVRRVGTGGNELTAWNPPPGHQHIVPQQSYQVLPQHSTYHGVLPQQSFQTIPQQIYQTIPQQSYQSASFDPHRAGNHTSIADFQNYGDGPPPLLTTENHVYTDENGTVTTALAPPRRWPTHSQARHQKALSMRSIRYDPKRNPYRFDTLSEIGSEGGDSSGGSIHNGVNPRPRRSKYYRSASGYAREGSPPEDVLRLPLTMWMNSNAKNHFVAMIAEFIGTTMFLFFAFAGTQVANIGAGETESTTNGENGFSPIVLLYISVSFGFSLMVNVWIFFRISGGLFNPAVTLAMTLVKALTYTRAILLLIAQLCGSLLASVLVRSLFPTPLNVRTTLSADTSLVRGIFIEALLTSELVFAIFMLAKEKHKATFIAPIGIGLALFVAELVGVYYTGGSLNPARSFGPCAITGVWDSEHWIYWLGPAIGAILAVCFYRFIKILEYEVANPGQDAKHDVEEAEAQAEAQPGTLPRHRTPSKEQMEN